MTKSGSRAAGRATNPPPDLHSPPHLWHVKMGLARMRQVCDNLPMMGAASEMPSRDFIYYIIVDDTKEGMGCAVTLCMG